MAVGQRLALVVCEWTSSRPDAIERVPSPNSGGVVDPGKTYLAVSMDNDRTGLVLFFDPLVITRNGGGVFSLQSFIALPLTTDISSSIYNADSGYWAASLFGGGTATGTCHFLVNSVASVTCPVNETNIRSMMLSPELSGVVNVDANFALDSFQTPASTPEPGTLAFFGTGPLNLAGWARRQRGKIQR
jgi:hypothetical protein